MNNWRDDTLSWWLDDPPSERQRIDVSKDDVAEVFGSCPLRMIDRDDRGKNWQIFYKGEWHWVCRTDLKDDVGVFAGEESPYDLMAMARYGARIRPSGYGPSVSFIVAFSDG